MSSSAVPGLEFFPAPADIYVPAGIAGPEAFTVKVQAFIVRRGEEVGLVDTLMQPDNIDLIEEALSRASAPFSDLRYVVITHHHPDHSGNLAEIARRGPRRGLSAALTTRRRSTERREWRSSRLKTATHCWVLTSLKLPATHPGHISLFDAVSSTMFLGDLAENSGQLPPPPARFTEDPALYQRTLRSVAELNFDNALPSHGDPRLQHAATMLLQLAEELHT